MNPKIVMTKDYLPDFIKNDIVFVDDAETVRILRFRADYAKNERIIKTNVETGVVWIALEPTTTHIKNLLNYLMTEAYPSTLREDAE